MCSALQQNTTTTILECISRTNGNEFHFQNFFLKNFTFKNYCLQFPKTYWVSLKGHSHLHAIHLPACFWRLFATCSFTQTVTWTQGPTGDSGAVSSWTTVLLVKLTPKELPICKWKKWKKKKINNNNLIENWCNASNCTGKFREQNCLCCLVGKCMQKRVESHFPHMCYAALWRTISKSKKMCWSASRVSD